MERMRVSRCLVIVRDLRCCCCLRQQVITGHWGLHTHTPTHRRWTPLRRSVRLVFLAPSPALVTPSHRHCKPRGGLFMGYRFFFLRINRSFLYWIINSNWANCSEFFFFEILKLNWNFCLKFWNLINLLLQFELN